MHKPTINNGISIEPERASSSNNNNWLIMIWRINESRRMRRKRKHQTNKKKTFLSFRNTTKDLCKKK